MEEDSPVNFLAERGIVLDGTGWPHGDVVVSEMLEKCKRSEVLDVIDDLIKHVETMGIASRFKQNRYAKQEYAKDQTNPHYEMVDYLFGSAGKLSEKGHKRESLISELKRVRGEISSLFSRLSTIRLDIEATNMEDDGSHVAKPSDEERMKQDIFHP